MSYYCAKHDRYDHGNECVACMEEASPGDDQPSAEEITKTLRAAFDALARESELRSALATAEALVISHEGHIASLEAQVARVRKVVGVERIDERLPVLEKSTLHAASQHYELGRLDMALLVRAALDGEGTR